MIEAAVNELNVFGAAKPLNMKRLATVKKNMMKYAFSAYETDGTVRYSKILMSAFFGLIKTESLVIAPLTKDAPLMSVDFITAFRRKTLLVEFYDLTLRPTGFVPAWQAIKASYADLPDNTLAPRWYDTLKLPCSLSKKGKKLGDRYDALCRQYAKAYVEYVKAAPDCDKTAKQACLRDYVEGMFVNGSPTVEVFSKLLDRTSARELYGRFLFFSED